MTLIKTMILPNKFKSASILAKLTKIKFLVVLSTQPAYYFASWRVDRAAECTGLENQRRFIPTQGSNP